MIPGLYLLTFKQKIMVVTPRYIWWMNTKDIDNLELDPLLLKEIIKVLSKCNEKCEEARLEASASIDKITGRE